MSFVATSPLFEGVDVHLVTVGASTDKQRDALRWGQEVLGEKCGRAEIVGGDVEGALKSDAARIEADMLVMGAYGHSPLRAMMVGSTTTATLTRLTLPVLLFR